MKYWIITYGCQMNHSDSERIAAILEKVGYRSASKENEADLIVVNMCSVRQSAVDRIFGLCQKFSKLKMKNKKLKILLTGCILKEDRKKFKNWFDLILNIKDLPNWLKNPQCQRLACGTVNHETSYLKIEPKYQNSFSAFVLIMTGCNNFCSFCVVPYTRGREISRRADEIISEVKNLVKRGYRDIILLGQNVNSYKSEIRAQSIKNDLACLAPSFRKRTAESGNKIINFSDLLKMINDIPGNFQIRFLTNHPKDMSNELIDTIAECKKVVKEIHLPVQSGDNEILKKMNRGYTVSQYKNLIKKIRQKIPEVKISTDIIVGFPGETKKQFENTVRLFKEIKFRMAYIAKYSPRPSTAAFKLKDNVSPAEKKRRYKVLNDLLLKNLKGQTG